MGRGGEAGGGRDDAATERNREKMQGRPGQGKEEQDGRGGAAEICMRGTFASEPTLLLALFALSPRVTTLLELESEQPERTNSREYRDWRDVHAVHKTRTNQHLLATRFFFSGYATHS